MILTKKKVFSVSSIRADAQTEGENTRFLVRSWGTSQNLFSSTRRNSSGIQWLTAKEMVIRLDV